MDNPSQAFFVERTAIPYTMNTHQFITSKKGILLIVLSVFFILAIAVTSLIASYSGESEKKMTVTSSTLPREQPELRSERLVDSLTLTSTEDKDSEIPDDYDETWHDIPSEGEEYEAAAATTKRTEQA